ncbi:MULTISPECIES: AI-2E family transporter [Rugamonas]|uniref:Predicted PurR-regulated permease PerM n=1 Tax=Rugamonas rubra TaxID=758825 RepID=A0A1I4HHC8_9BURK|nr:MULTISPECIES: AI-2E family transporter [Rugamonas]WGG50994.1 AI-2E family transporter [Rugamonas sp. DEMB1]SFL41592.1 Predicted PurR-regulated permease PerM [Rugamonas rubra]
MPFPLSLEQKQTAFWIAVWGAFLLLLLALGPVLTPFLAAAILAYALNPGVDRLDHLRFRRFDVPRPLAVVVVVVLFFCAIAALVLIVVPVLQKEIPLLQAQIPAFLAKLNDLLGPRLQELGLKVRLDSAGIKKIVSQQMASSGEAIWSAVLASARVGGTAVLGWIATVVLIPVVLFYLLLDWHPMLARVAAAVPRRYIGRTLAMANEVDTLLAQYLRGQLLVMLVLAVYYSVGLMIAGFDVALPVGIITGLLVFIPYLGFGLGLVLALIAAVLQFADWSGVIAVAAIYGLGQVIEGFFLTPRLVGERIGLNPLAVIFALLAFGQLFGFVGVLLALPASAILMVAFKHLRRHYLSSSFYNA